MFRPIDTLYPPSMVVYTSPLKKLLKIVFSRFSPNASVVTDAPRIAKRAHFSKTEIRSLALRYMGSASQLGADYHREP